MCLLALGNLCGINEGINVTLFDVIRRPLERRAKYSRSQGVNLPPLLTAHLGRRKNGQPQQSTLTFVFGGHQHLTNSGGNILSKGMYLSHNAPPFIPNSLQPTSSPISTYVNPYSQQNIGVAYEQPLSFPPQAQGGNSSFGETSAYYPYGGYVPQVPTSNHVPTHNSFIYPSNAPPNSYPFYTQPINPLPNAPAYPNYGPTGLFAEFTGCVTPFIFWIKDYPLPDGLKMPSHVGSYDGKGDLDNYLHLFEAKEAATNRAPNDHRESFDRFKKRPSWDNNKGKENKDKFPLYSRPNHGLLSNLSKCPREIIATKKIKEAVRSGQLAHLVKGIKKGKAKVSDTQLGGWKKRDKDTVPAESPILMINMEGHLSKRKAVGELVSGIREITFPPVSGINNSFNPVIIKAWISGRDSMKSQRSDVGSQPCYSKEKQRRLEDVRRLHEHKQSFPQRLLPLTRDRLKCLLDTYKGYHQIQIGIEDEEKTAFFAGKGVFCYRKMSFSLKNAGATYQRLVDKVFNDQIGRNLEINVDDMVIKSTSEEDM
ncbi:hypothetical protein Tco_1330918 [Tanacetum coccineum]